MVDVGVSPIDEASIRITTINSLLERATKLPLSEDLTHEVQMLKELRFKVTDPAVTAQISQVLESYENKKQELEQKADASAKAEQAAQDAKAQQALARSDSLNALQALQAAKDKKAAHKAILLLLGGLQDNLDGLLLGISYEAAGVDGLNVYRAGIILRDYLIGIPYLIQKVLSVYGVL